MSQDGEEAEDLSKLGGCLILNMGTVQPQTIQNYLQALAAYNKAGGPVLLDPVGAGATQLRRQTVKQLLAGGYFDIIKGNESEISVVYGSGKIQQKGVDSGESTATDEEKARLTKKVR
jgi:thiamine-phosphate diphosphorylase / hydroxyethylthiazole kinase